jgi:hypothetical protein
MRSTKAPTIRAGVMMANVIWNMKNRVSGMTGTIEHLAACHAGQHHLAEAADPWREPSVNARE